MPPLETSGLPSRSEPCRCGLGCTEVAYPSHPSVCPPQLVVRVEIAPENDVSSLRGSYSRVCAGPPLSDKVDITREYGEFLLTPSDADTDDLSSCRAVVPCVDSTVGQRVVHVGDGAGILFGSTAGVQRVARDVQICNVCLGLLDQEHVVGPA